MSSLARKPDMCKNGRFRHGLILRFKHGLILMLTGLFCLMTTSACSPFATSSTAATSGTASAIGTAKTSGTQTDLANGTTTPPTRSAPEIATQLEDGPSGPLRIWWTQRDSLNPLLEDSKAGQAVNDLVFQGLFNIKDDQSIEPQLAKNLTFWQSGLQALVILDEGHFFHDGSPVTLDDAAACLSFILDPANQSVYAAGLAAVESVQVIDHAALELRLKRPDPWLAYALTFPIIPAASLNAEQGELIPGTGRYQMTSFDPNVGLHLVYRQKDDPEGLQEIIVRMYEDQLAAMQAMERDELDLVYLDARDCSRYIMRSSLRLSLFTGNELYLVSCNTADGHPLADADRLVTVKQMIQAASLTGTDAASWGELTNLGIPDGSWLTEALQTDSSDGQLDAYAVRLSQIALPATYADQEPGDEKESLQIVVAAEDERRVRLAGILAEQLSAGGVASEVIPLTVDLFWPALEAGDYDLALLAAVLTNAPDPAWLYRRVRPEPWMVIDRLNPDAVGLDEYAAWQEKLISVIPDNFRKMTGVLATEPLFADTLVETAVRSPWCILELLYEGLAYGDRVYGQCKPNRYHPYQHVEELWVWSGQ